MPVQRSFTETQRNCSKSHRLHRLLNEFFLFFSLSFSADPSVEFNKAKRNLCLYWYVWGGVRWTLRACTWIESVHVCEWMWRPMHREHRRIARTSIVSLPKRCSLREQHTKWSTQGAQQKRKTKRTEGSCSEWDWLNTIFSVDSRTERK